MRLRRGGAHLMAGRTMSLPAGAQPPGRNAHLTALAQRLWLLPAGLQHSVPNTTLSARVDHSCVADSLLPRPALAFFVAPGSSFGSSRRLATAEVEHAALYVWWPKYSVYNLTPRHPRATIESQVQ